MGDMNIFGDWTMLQPDSRLQRISLRLIDCMRMELALGRSGGESMDIWGGLCFVEGTLDLTRGVCILAPASSDQSFGVSFFFAPARVSFVCKRS